jgi:hypothetical protein
LFSVSAFILLFWHSWTAGQCRRHEDYPIRRSRGEKGGTVVEAPGERWKPIDTRHDGDLQTRVQAPVLESRTDAAPARSDHETSSLIWNVRGMFSAMLMVRASSSTSTALTLPRMPSPFFGT